MRREAPRTLYSLSADYQRDVSSRDYSVLVVENGSSDPLSPAEVTQFGSNFDYLRIDDASPSPAAAINLGAARAGAPFLGVMIDGARMLSPGALSLALTALTRFHRTIVATVGYHIGPDKQTRSPQQGYNREAEDQLLARIDWRNHGYRLFRISSLAGGSPDGWLGNLLESNLLFLPKALFDELEGFDERFSTPGGGLVNLDFYRRACDLDDTTLISLFGEATFHQIHGGTMTNRPQREMIREFQAYRERYLEIRGFPYESSPRQPLLLGFPKPEIVPDLITTCHRVQQRLVLAGLSARGSTPRRLGARLLALLKSLRTRIPRRPRRGTGRGR